MPVWLKLYRLQGYIHQVHDTPQSEKNKMSTCQHTQVCTTTQRVWFLILCLHHSVSVLELKPQRLPRTANQDPELTRKWAGAVGEGKGRDQEKWATWAPHGNTFWHRMQSHVMPLMHLVITFWECTSLTVFNFFWTIRVSLAAAKHLLKNEGT